MNIDFVSARVKGYRRLKSVQFENELAQLHLAKAKYNVVPSIYLAVTYNQF